MKKSTPHKPSHCISLNILVRDLPGIIPRLPRTFPPIFIPLFTPCYFSTDPFRQTTSTNAPLIWRSEGRWNTDIILIEELRLGDFLYLSAWSWRGEGGRGQKERKHKRNICAKRSGGREPSGNDFEGLVTLQEVGENDWEEGLKKKSWREVGFFRGARVWRGGGGDLRWIEGWRVGRRKENQEVGWDGWIIEERGEGGVEKREHLGGGSSEGWDFDEGGFEEGILGARIGRNEHREIWLKRTSSRGSLLVESTNERGL